MQTLGKKSRRDAASGKMYFVLSVKDLLLKSGAVLRYL